MFSLASTIVSIRSTVLTLSLVIVILSLAIYSFNTKPFSILLHEDEALLSTEMVKDRRLISTLVAAQASIFCPLFLLEHREMKSATELLCQFLMPFGLALSWVFCILFDQKTEAALINEGLVLSLDMPSWVAAVNGFKYLLVGLLILEAVMVWLAIFKLGTTSAIQLPENDNLEANPLSQSEKHMVIVV